MWENEVVPSIGDEIRISSDFIYQKDKKYFPRWMKGYSMTFIVKNRLWNLNKSTYYDDYDVFLKLDWTEKELLKVKEYLDKPKTK